MNEFLKTADLGKSDYTLYLEYSNFCLENNNTLICYANFETRIAAERDNNKVLSIGHKALLTVQDQLNEIGRA